MSWPLFIVTRTGRCRQTLRRFAGERACAHSGYSYCNAETLFADDVPTPINNGCIESREKPPDDDPRWPERCACGYEFVDADKRQLFVVEYYAAEDGRRWPIRDLPPGAMYDAWWWPERGPNGGPWWTVVLPPGGHNDTWEVYGPAANSKRPWTITGTAPKFTASPSIASPRYHGWLRDGVLTPDCEGRIYGA